MTYLRHAVRHVQKTIIDRIHAGLVSDGWLGQPDGEGPFGVDPITWVPRRMAESELIAAVGNLVAVSFGPEPDEVPQELGGGLTSITHTVFVDIIGEEGAKIGGDTLSIAMASDIKDRLSGIQPDSSRFEPVYDYTTLPRTPVVGYLIEFENVVRSRPEGDDARRLWNVVAADAVVTFTGND